MATLATDISNFISRAQSKIVYYGNEISENGLNGQDTKIMVGHIQELSAALSFIQDIRNDQTNNQKYELLGYMGHKYNLNRMPVAYFQESQLIHQTIVYESSNSPGTASPLTTKGDLYTYGSSNARLAVGANDRYLKADSTQTVGLVWGDFGTDVRATTLTGYVSGAGTITTADTILTAIQKLNGNISAISYPVTSVFGRTGAITATSGDYTTAQITEVTNLFFTNARAIASTLTGYTSGAGTVSSSDSVLSAIQKLNGNTTAVAADLVTNYMPLIGADITGSGFVLTADSFQVFSGSAGVDLYYEDGAKYAEIQVLTSLTKPTVYIEAGDATNSVLFEINNTIAKIRSDNSGFIGLQYNGDYTASFATRSLIDKGYLDGRISSTAYTVGGWSSTTIAPSRSAVASQFVAIEAQFNIRTSKNAVRVATTANITLSGNQTIDGISVLTGDRVLVKNQSSGADNGIYVCDTSTWIRSVDSDASFEILGATIYVVAGTANGGKLFSNTNTTVPTLGSTSLTYAQLGNSGTVTSVTGTASRISVATGTTTPVIDIDAAYVGQASITTLGTITTGVWSGTVIVDGKIASALTGKTYNGLTVTTTTATLTLAGNLITTGAFNTTFAQGATSTVTMPTYSGNMVLSNGALTTNRIPYMSASGLIDNSAFTANPASGYHRWGAGGSAFVSTFALEINASSQAWQVYNVNNLTTSSCAFICSNANGVGVGTGVQVLMRVLGASFSSGNMNIAATGQLQMSGGDLHIGINTAHSIGIWANNIQYGKFSSGGLLYLGGSSTAGSQLELKPGASTIGLIIGQTSGTADLTQWKSSSPATISSVNYLGGLVIGDTTEATTATATCSALFAGGVGINKKLFVTGATTLTNLAGTGTRMVTTSSTGLLSSAYFPYTIKSEYANVTLPFNAATDFYSTTMPAATLLNNGDFIEVEYTIDIPVGGQDAAGTLEVYFAGISILSQTLVSSGKYRIGATIVRVDATTVRVTSSTIGGTISYSEQTVANLTSNTTVVKGVMTTTATATVDSNARMGRIKFFPKEA